MIFFQKKSTLNESEKSKEITKLFDELFVVVNKDEFYRNTLFVRGLTSKEANSLIEEVGTINFNQFITSNNLSSDAFAHLKHPFIFSVYYGYWLYLISEVVEKKKRY